MHPNTALRRECHISQDHSSLKPVNALTPILGSAQARIKNTIAYDKLFLIRYKAAFFLALWLITNMVHLQARDSVLVLSDAWMQAMTENDVINIDKYMTDDYYLVLIGRRDGRIPKPEWMSNLKYYTHLGYENPHVITLDSTTKIVSYREQFTVTEDAWYQPKFKTWAPIVDIWVKTGGDWKVKRRLAGDWALFLWWDRALGFITGIAFLGIILFIRRGWQKWSAKRTQASS